MTAAPTTYAVVVPSMGRPSLQWLLDTLAAQDVDADHPGPLEVVVVDDRPGRAGTVPRRPRHDRMEGLANDREPGPEPEQGAAEEGAGSVHPPTSSPAQRAQASPLIRSRRGFRPAAGGRSSATTSPPGQPNAGSNDTSRRGTRGPSAAFAGGIAEA